MNEQNKIEKNGMGSWTTPDTAQAITMTVGELLDTGSMFGCSQRTSPLRWNLFTWDDNGNPVIPDTYFIGGIHEADADEGERA